MSIVTVARRRKGRAVRATIPQADMDAHGAGYPLTYRFTVPDTPGLKAQWRTGVGAWQDLAVPPVGRFDGIDTARIAGGVAYVSKAFEPDTPELYLRVVDGETAVGDFVGIERGYDGRMAVPFTYDDTPTIPQWEASTDMHQSLRLWMSPGLNFGPQHLTTRSFTLEAAASGVAGGYVEVVNHTYNHDSADRYASQAAADDDYGINDAIIKASVGLPPQSRGRVLSCIYPYGSFNALAHLAASKLGCLTGRLVIGPTEPVERGTYAPGLWDDELGMVPRQQASVNPRAGGASMAGLAMRAIDAAKVLAAVNYARTNGLEQCIVYSYIRHWVWDDPAEPWAAMLAEVSAMPDVWSVGYGHMALYQRTRDRTLVEWVSD